MGELLTPTHLMVIAIVGFVFFGGKKLPELGRGIGEGLRGFKEGIKGLAVETNNLVQTPARPEQKRPSSPEPPLTLLP